MTKSFTGWFSIVAILMSCNSKPIEEAARLGSSVANDDSEVSVYSTDVEITEDAAAADGASTDTLAPLEVAAPSLTCSLAPSQGETRYEYPLRCGTGSASTEFAFTFSRNGEAANILRPIRFDASTITWVFNVPIFPGDSRMELTAKLIGDNNTLSAKIDTAALLTRKNTLTLAPVADPTKNYFMIAGNGASCLTKGENFTTSDGATLQSLTLKPCSSELGQNFTWKLIKNANRAPNIEFLGRVTGSVAPECLDIIADQFVIGTPLIRYSCHYLDSAKYPNAFNQDFNLQMKSATEFVVQSAAAPALCLGFNTAASSPQIQLVDCAAGNPVLFKAFEVPVTL